MDRYLECRPLRFRRASAAELIQEIAGQYKKALLDVIP